MRLCLYPLGIDLMNQLKQDYPVIRPSIMALFLLVRHEEATRLQTKATFPLA